LARIEAARQATHPAEPEPLETIVGNIDHVVICRSAAIRRVRRMIEICTRSTANVLLCGETGVGKDLVAAAIHRNSLRHAFPFVKVGCTLFPSQLIESELYGHERGSFTGAEQRRKGRFELAEGGTLYLDDVDDIPLEHQAKLLRAIEEKVFERVGGTTPIRADVRIIASTKRNLLEKIADGTFRQDLYYRLDVLRVNIPPLRERREDAALLTEHLLARIATDQPACLEPAAVEVLQRHDWPGNVRELLHVLHRAYLIGSGRITADLLASEIADAGQSQRAPPGAFQATIDKTERDLLENALATAGGNKTAAAAALGMKPSTFRDKLVKHGLL
jgi:DNA-binding NtrC family response regulator